MRNLTKKCQRRFLAFFPLRFMGLIMDLGLRGKTALVFGGSKGLGRGTADALAAEGVNLALVARDQGGLDRAADEISRSHGVTVHGFSADLADHEATLAAVAAAESALGGRIDILLNNTGGPPPGGVTDIDPALWQAQFHAMILSIFRITDRVLPTMRRAGWGRILTVASTAVVEPNPALGISNTLRSALIGWSKTLASEVGADGVTANVLLPGKIATDRTVSMDQWTADKQGVTLEQVRADKVRAVPVRRYGTPAEFGAVAAFLASEQAAYVTGSVVRVDGGVVRSV